MKANTYRRQAMFWGISVGSLLIVMNACNSTPDGMDLSSKSSLASSGLEKFQVFDATTNPLHNKTPTVHIPESPWSPASIETNVHFFCTTHWYEEGHPNLLNSPNIELQFLNADNSIACHQSSATLRSDLINLKKLTVSSCASMANGVYTLKLVNVNNQTDNLLRQHVVKVRKQGTDFDFVNPDNTNEVLENPDIWVFYNLVSHATDGQPGDVCEVRVSPLVIDTRGKTDAPQPIQVSAPLDGIMFDILGWRSWPMAHAKKQISWIDNFERYRFLVRATSDGKVNGIDQMFGDNTRGPDGTFAENGFKALAKFDGKDVLGQRVIRRADGVIDGNDEIYAKLSLWADRNMNGTVEAGELQSLKDAGVKSIDLNYDPNYSEEDQWGNKTNYKSLVKFSDGRERLIFDLWFRYLNQK